MELSRTENSIKNSGMAVFAHIISILLSFVGRTFFIKFLNVDYLGVNGLFTNILTILSLAELGIGSAITYMMYSPIANGEHRKVAAYNFLFKRVYNTIGLIIFVIGLFIMPFLPDIIKGTPDISENLYIVYLLFLINTVSSYFFTYKRSLLIAHQKEYINSKNIVFFAIVKDIVLIVVLYVTTNFYFYLLAQIGITILSNIAISRKTDKLFPEIAKYKKEKVPKQELKVIIRNTLAMLCHKIGSVIVSGTDSILISSFVGIATVGVYSNYKLICYCLQQTTIKFTNSVTASIGNLAVSADGDKVIAVFRKLYFINFTLAFFVSCFFYTLSNAFIKIWIGDSYLLDDACLLIITIDLFIYQIRQPAIVIINAYGLFWPIKWKSIWEAVINLLVSLYLVIGLKLGILGVLLGTMISTLATNIWWEPFVAYRYGMRTKQKGYYKELIKSFISFFIAIVILHFSVKYINGFVGISLIMILLISALVATFVLLVVYFLFYSRNEEFKYATKLLCSIGRNLLKK
ncbi:hypothetical protein [Bacteroides acidifaciens]|uniref:lipopolysaccharide biosynthesis protein n=1 Tax=Bacteroides acidifaciens TaxID=85831 RepID=UPI003014B910